MMEPTKDEILCGLCNEGNTCYLNSTLQVLVSQRDFMNALRHVKTNSSASYVTESSNSLLVVRRKLFCLFSSLPREMGKSSKPVLPSGIRRLLFELNSVFTHCDQADAAECLLTLLASLEEHLSDNVLIENESSTCVPSKIRSSSSYYSLYDTLQRIAQQRAALHHKHERRKFSQEIFHHSNLLSSCQIDRTSTSDDTSTSQKHHAPEPFYIHSPKAYVRRGVVNTFFEGYHLNTFYCHHCQYSSHSAEPFLMLELHIPSHTQLSSLDKINIKRLQKSSPMFSALFSVLHPFTALAKSAWDFVSSLFTLSDGISPALRLQDCFASHERGERLSHENAILCDHCGVRSEGIRTTQLLHLPPILVIHLKRFSHGIWSTEKLHTAVSCPEILDLSNSVCSLEKDTVCGTDSSLDGENRAKSSDFDPPALCFSKDAHKTALYELSAVINHHGNLSSGHYTAYVRNPSVGWVLCNDEHLLRVSTEEVLQSEVYVAVYRRKY